MNDFGLWMSQEIEKRGWSRSEAARRGGISSSTIDKVINEFAQPGPRLCRGLARAFGMAPEEVFRLANLLPPKAPFRIAENGVVYRISDRNIERQLLETFRALGPEDRERVLDLVLRLAGQVEPRIVGETTTAEE